MRYFFWCWSRHDGVLRLFRIIQLGIFNGDAVLLKGKKRKDTVCIALVEEGLEDSSIRMSKVRALPFIMCCNMYSIPYCSQRPCWFAGLYGDKELLAAKRRGCWGECVCEAFRPSARFRVSLSVLPRVLVCWYCHELLLVPHTRLRTNTCTRRADSKYLHTCIQYCIQHTQLSVRHTPTTTRWTTVGG